MSIIADDNDFDSKPIAEKKKSSVIKSEVLDNDKNFENCIRPKTFDTYIGQSALKETLKISIAAAKKENFLSITCFFMVHLDWGKQLLQE